MEIFFKRDIEESFFIPLIQKKENVAAGENTSSEDLGVPAELAQILRLGQAPHSSGIPSLALLSEKQPLRNQSPTRDKASIQQKINLLQIVKKEVANGVISTRFPGSDSKKVTGKKYSTWHFANVFPTASPPVQLKNLD